MTRLLQFTAIFCVLFAASSAAVVIALPHMVAWNFDHCETTATVSCALSANVLAYWWLAILPFLALATLLMRHALFGRRTDADRDSR